MKLTRIDKPEPSSRRRFFTFGAATVIGSAVALRAQQAPATDVDILNYALTLEQLEAAFYVEGMAKFAGSDFNKSAFAAALGDTISNNVYQNFQAIRDHELAHVATLTGLIKKLGGTPVTACTYKFGYTTLDEYVKVAQTLENTGVMAYDGAIAGIASPDLRTAGATIATVEARHASYLNLINGKSPFPSSFDTPKSMAEILTAVAPFIVACPTTPPVGVTTAVANPKNTGAASSITLDGTASTSSDGKPLKYQWTLQSFRYAAIENPTSATPTVTFLGGTGYYTFQLTVTDSAGKTSTDATTLFYGG